MPSESAPRKPHSPVRVGKYEVTSHIATGGMGAVYRARDTETGGEVALKVLTPEMAAKPSMVERFRREARSAAKLRHENIVKVFEFGECGGTYFIVMEYVDGIDLMTHIDDHGPLDPEETRQIMIQACRALKTAHEQGIVHRDIKPSNILVTRKNGRVFIKLTDLGLAREANADDFRVTRSGTTVGTVDYMAPEQARDSGLADVRSDLYALGCTWFHMLANQAPFPEGGLAERILKHMQVAPPDVRDFNPRASKALSQILNRLLEKKPVDRYQTPADLLDDLLSLDPVAKVKPKKPRNDEDETVPMATRGPRRPSKTSKSARTTHIATKIANGGSKRGVWVVVGLAAAVVLLVGVCVAIAFALRSAEPPDDNSGGQVVVAPPPAAPSPPIPPPTLVTPPTTRPNGVPPPKARLTPLYEPRAPLDVSALRARIDAPWANVVGPPENATVLRVSRLKMDGNATAFTSVADACAAAIPGQPVVIEINDNGPLYQSTAVVTGKVFLRAGKGYRPLLVWDINRTLQERKNPKNKEPLALFQVDGGSLTLNGIDVAVKWPEGATDSAALLQVTDGDLDAQNCTFSVAGKHPDGIAWVRFRSQKSEPTRCRLQRCFARGGSLVALQLDAPNAEVLLDSCLVAGGEPALVQVRSAKDNPATVRVVRSTLVTANTLLNVQPVPADIHEPALHWLGWDTLLCRSNEQIGGTLVVLPDKALTSKLRWEAVGVLYAGWKTLLGGSSPLSADARDFITWDVTWDLKEGDRALDQRFPAAVFADPAQLPTSAYATATTPVAFASTRNPEESLGCRLGELPPARENWLAFTFDRFPVSQGEVLDSPEKPAIEQPDKTGFHGARLELTPAFDLGAYLRDVQKTQPFGPKVVLHLAGAGEQKTSPIHIKGSSLVLYFEPPARDDAKPLSLTPQGGAADALVQVEDGNLDVINGELTLPDGGKVPNHLLKVSGGDLRLYRCRLQAAHQAGADANTGLIDFQGSGATASDKGRACLVNQSVLSCGFTAIDLHGVGGRVLLRQSAIVTSGDALHVEVGPAFAGQANVQCVLEQSTLAARHAVIHVGDVAATPWLQEPVVVQSLNCAFLNPFAEASARPGLLRCDGEALPRGLVVWQGDGDFFDKRLAHGVVPPAGATGEAKNGSIPWSLLWGTVGMRKPAVDLVTAPKPFDGNTWPLDRLVLAFQPASTKKKPGADLSLFAGTDKKKPRPL